ncbi:DUF4126 domain-containing protein [soil metagenome]
MNATQIITHLSLLMGASWCAGINLYATVAVLGLMNKYTSFHLPPEMQVLSNNWVMWPAVVLYFVEFIADKIPAVDSVWDTFHTFIRVPAGAALAAMAIGDVPVEAQLFAGLIGGTLALGSHTTKATTRLAAHATGTSPIVSPVVSVVEDVFVVGTMGLLATHPLVALVGIALTMVAAYFILKAFWKLARKVWRGLFGGRSPRREEMVSYA